MHHEEACFSVTTTIEAREVRGLGASWVLAGYLHDRHSFEDVRHGDVESA